MPELYEQILLWMNVIWRRRWAALAVAWLVCFTGWYVVISKPDTYTATTRIFIDTASVLQPLLRGLAIERDISAEVQAMKESVQSRPNMERVLRLTDLDLEASNPSEFQELIDKIRSRTTVESDGYMFDISYTDIEPLRARDISEAIAKVFIEQNLGQNLEEIEDARTFLDRQIKDYERQLEEAENELAVFKTEKLSALPERTTAAFQLEQLRTALEDAEAELKGATIRRDTLRRQVAVAPASGIEVEIAETLTKIDQLKLKFTEQHPDVQALRRHLIELNNRRSDELRSAGIDPSSRAARSSGGSGELSADVYQELRNSLAAQEANVVVSAEEVSRLRERLARFESLVAQVPTVEAELARLNRDYDVLREKHSELVGRREQAIMSQRKETGTERLQFKVVEPARAPIRPNGPARPFLLTAVLVFGIGIGVAFAMFLSVINETFSDAAKLRQAFNLPVLGSVSRVRTPTKQTLALAGHSTFLSLLGTLVIVYAMLLLNISAIRELDLFATPLMANAFVQVSAFLGI